MDAYSLLRTMGALAVVLGLLAGALWIVRRYDIGLPGRVANGGSSRRVEVVERTTLDGRRSVALVRRDHPTASAAEYSNVGLDWCNAVFDA